jgi:hypothetical protein
MIRHMPSKLRKAVDAWILVNEVDPEDIGAYLSCAEQTERSP